MFHVFCCKLVKLIQWVDITQRKCWYWYPISTPPLPTHQFKVPCKYIRTRSKTWAHGTSQIGFRFQSRLNQLIKHYCIDCRGATWQMLRFPVIYHYTYCTQRCCTCGLHIMDVSCECSLLLFLPILYMNHTVGINVNVFQCYLLSTLRWAWHLSHLLSNTAPFSSFVCIRMTCCWTTVKRLETVASQTRPPGPRAPPLWD